MTIEKLPLLSVVAAPSAEPSEPSGLTEAAVIAAPFIPFCIAAPETLTVGVAVGVAVEVAVAVAVAVGVGVGPTPVHVRFTVSVSSFFVMNRSVPVKFPGAVGLHATST